MSKPLRLGVVGLRNIGKGHVSRCRQVADADVVAVADARQDRLDETCEKYSEANPKQFSDFRGNINRPFFIQQICNNQPN